MRPVWTLTLSPFWVNVCLGVHLRGAFFAVVALPSGFGGASSLARCCMQHPFIDKFIDGIDSCLTALAEELSPNFEPTLT